MAMLQNNFTAENFSEFRRQYNLNLVNLANIQTDFIVDLPKTLNKISEYTDKISNLTIIAGNCYLSKVGKDFKELENKNIIFNKDFNTVKLEPELSYVIEPVEYKNKIISNQKHRIYDNDKKELRNIDDLLIRKEPINIVTEENRYEYILSLNFNELKTFNNINLKLGSETLSYPTISKVYYIDNTNQQKILKLINLNAFNMDLDLYKNSDNNYELDLETISSDNIQIVMEDNLESLTINELSVNYTDYTEEGYVIVEALKESKPILKVGLEGQADDNIDFEVSYNSKDWFPIDLSNTFDMRKTNRVVSFNTVSPNTINSATDVKSLYLKIKLKTIKNSYKDVSKLNKETYRNSTFNVLNLNFSEYSLYKNTDSVYYGKKSNVSKFDYKDLYDKGEYIISDNKYFVKGFIETAISKTVLSKYTYSPVTLKSKEVKKNGKIIKFDDIDISTKEIYNYKIEKFTKNLLEITSTEYVLPLEDNVPKSIYYIKQDNNEIEVDLSLGFINSAIDVLYTVKPQVTVYLLDSFKNLVKELTPFEVLEVDEEAIFAVSLIEEGLFKPINNLSKTYPVTPLKQYELGLIDNDLISNNSDIEVTFYELLKTELYLTDTISNDNSNYSRITSEEEYLKNCTSYFENIKSYKKEIKLVNNSILKGSIKLKGLSVLEVPFINGYNEFLEYFSKKMTISIPKNLNTNVYRVELLEDEVIKNSISYILPTNIEDNFVVSIVEIDDKFYVEISSNLELPSFNLNFNYTFKNNNPKELYSVNYTKGIIFFSEPTTNNVEIEYLHDNILCIGKSANQLLSGEFIDVNNNINIKNYEENSSIYFIYKNNIIKHRKLTPILKDLRLNYIIKDDMSL